ncbi:hypothetical protein DOTSEDRAFT_69437 [Dothistroma septosporum NZE10]|uniref:Mitochondrial intermembrane space import and assembly protein 40 n=1 Tax=Dothistroma septosporum (strain NZE10 / CBS 128990) TaxID=675120 RepID=N1PYL1_DOTSN|nr:hypothetical protein DOTSEDRAFT_69437 [Dothistroma septosporum NZE10]
MFRPAFRAVTAARTIPNAQFIGRRFASTAAPKSRSWKGSAVRWAAAGAIVYYYNTATVFAEEPKYATHAPPETSNESETYQNVDSIAEQRRARARATQKQSPPSEQTPEADSSVPDGEREAAAGPEALKEEADQQGAFNEETGEINWDCPCLGGMAHGPCGEQFKAAFSCFVYSKEEPKGVDCIEHFKTMQNCFREHPEIYGSELDEEEVDAQIDAEGKEASSPVSRQPAPTPVTAETSSTISSYEPEHQERVRIAKDQVQQSTGPQDEADHVVPKAWHDGREASTAK